MMTWCKELVLWLLSSVMLLVVGCSDDAAVLVDVNGVVTTNCTIEQLKDYYKGESNIIVDDVVIEGQVVANDMMGEFPDIFILQDDSGAIVVSAELYDEDIQGVYKLGARVKIYCGQLWIGGDVSYLILGCEPDADKPVGVVSQEELAWRCVSMGDEMRCEPYELRISEMNQGVTSLISRFVVVRGVQLSSGDASPLERRYCDIDDESGRHVATSHLFVDSDGNEVEVSIASTVEYADEIIPCEMVDIYAILDHFAGRYYLRPIAMGVISQS